MNELKMIIMWVIRGPFFSFLFGKTATDINGSSVLSLLRTSSHRFLFISLIRVSQRKALQHSKMAFLFVISCIHI